MLFAALAGFKEPLCRKRTWREKDQEKEKKRGEEGGGGERERERERRDEKREEVPSGSCAHD
jgi:hypothetical protein